MEIVDLEPMPFRLVGRGLYGRVRPTQRMTRGNRRSAWFAARTAASLGVAWSSAKRRKSVTLASTQPAVAEFASAAAAAAVASLRNSSAGALQPQTAERDLARADVGRKGPAARRLQAIAEDLRKRGLRDLVEQLPKLPSARRGGSPSRRRRTKT